MACCTGTPQTLLALPCLRPRFQATPKHSTRLERISPVHEFRSVSAVPRQRIVFFSALRLQRRRVTERQEEAEVEVGEGDGVGDGDGGGDGGDGGFSWISNLPVFFLWAGLAAYVISPYSPNQTPYRDQLFLEKLLFLRGDEGFSLNPVLVTVWYTMGLLPLIYTMLLIPSGRSAKGGVPVWPFSAASFFVGIFALLPYFGVWNPPPPRVTKEELTKFPLLLLESKIFSGFVLAAAVGLGVKAAVCGGESFQQYWNFFRESRFIHVMSIDFVLLNLLAVVWVSNDMAVRKFKGSWLTFVSVVPLVGPALYLLLRPSLPPQMIED